MIERRLGWATALAVWTLLVWATRIDNIWADEALDTAAKLGRTALAGSFVIFAVLTLGWVWRQRRAGFPPCTAYLLGPFAAWTVAVWVVRGAGILVADHGAAFKVVHSALAAVSITLAALAWRSLRRVLAGEVSPGDQPAARTAQRSGDDQEASRTPS